VRIFVNLYLILQTAWVITKYKNVGLQEQERKTIYLPEVSARVFQTKTHASHM